MTAEEIIERSGNILGLAKIVLGGVITAVTGIVAVAVWVNSTATTIAQTQEKQMVMQKVIETIQSDRLQVKIDYDKWRSDKDKQFERLLAVQEGQQRILDRQQVMLDELVRRSFNKSSPAAQSGE